MQQLRTAFKTALSLAVFIALCACARSLSGLPLQTAATAVTHAKAIDCYKDPATFDFPSGVKFGSAEFYAQPSVVMLSSTRALEAHVTHDNQLAYSFGTVTRGSVKWGESSTYADSRFTVSLASFGDRVVSFEGFNRQLYYRLGTIHGDTITWATPQAWDTGYKPHVAFLSSDKIVEVHHDGCFFECNLWLRVGRIEGDKIQRFADGGRYDTGEYPTIASDGRGNVVELHSSNTRNTLWYNVGTLDAANNRIVWVKSNWDNLTGTRRGIATIAWDRNGALVAGYTGQQNGGWLPRYFTTFTGTVDVKSGTVAWAPWRSQSLTTYWKDASHLPIAGVGSVAAYDDSGVVEYVDHGALQSATSSLTDREDWECNALSSSLRGKTLRQAVLPGSRNAGMYGAALQDDPYQENSVYEQLMGGQRYFDLRPSLSGGVFYIHRGKTVGAKLTDVLSDVFRFSGSHKEVVVLQLSDWENFAPQDTAFRQLETELKGRLAPFLFVNSSKLRLADVPIEKMLIRHGIVIPVLDVDFAENGGLYTYRDWDVGHPQAGQFNVYNRSTNTGNPETMASDQLANFADYDGKMERDPSVPCDLFLLNWTVEASGIFLERQWRAAQPADAALLPAAQGVSPNKDGLIPNILLTDFYGSADAVDAAIGMNERFKT